MARALVAPVWKDFQPGEFEQRGPYPKAATLALVDTARMVGMIEDQVLNPDRPMLARRRPGALRGRSARRGRDARRAPPAGDGRRGAARPRRPGPRRPGRRPR